MLYMSIRDLTHDPKLALALGNMVVAWADAERALISVFAHISKLDYMMAIRAYYRIPTLESRVKVIRALLEESKVAKKRRLAMETELARLNRLAATRNQWIHNSWCAGPGIMSGPSANAPTVIFNYREPPDSDKRRRSIKAADVRNHVRALHRCSEELHLLSPAKKKASRRKR